VSIKELAHKIWFANSRWSRMVCPCCGYRFELEDSIIRITVGDNTKYFHEDCLKEMNGQEALEFFEVEIEEVEI
jgi:hypothetical protein